MAVDFYAKSQDLLATLANSIHDREAQGNNLFTFNVNEVLAAEKWLADFVKEIKKDCVCL